ncbi:DUF3331 domain-containing protein [Paraburkholderia sp. RL16-012-BIC-B]|nr:DUF3331 domain-containing protein [Paraburkholderia madseniana]
MTAIERHNDKSAYISWCDPTMGHYVDQLWIMMKAPSVGRCALTGQSIKKGSGLQTELKNIDIYRRCSDAKPSRVIE